MLNEKKKIKENEELKDTELQGKEINIEDAEKVSGGVMDVIYTEPVEMTEDIKNRV